MPRNRENAIEKAKGLWEHILPALNIPSSFLVGKHGPCPLCGGKDRFRWDNIDGNGTYYCSQCDAGNGMSLVMKKNNWEFLEACDRVLEFLGDNGEIKPHIPKKKNGEKMSEDAKEEINLILSQALPIRQGPEALAYLKSRKLSTVPPSLLFHKELWHPYERKTFPGIVAKIESSEGKIVGLHKTYLGKDSKADIEKYRLMSKTIETISGAAVRLRPVKETGKPELCGRVGVAEGLETALIVNELYGLPVWAVLSTSGMASFKPPEGVKHVSVFMDRDKNYAGQLAGFKLLNRLHNEGYETTDYMPRVLGDDFLDEFARIS